MYALYTHNLPIRWCSTRKLKTLETGSTLDSHQWGSFTARRDRQVLLVIRTWKALWWGCWKCDVWIMSVKISKSSSDSKSFRADAVPLASDEVPATADSALRTDDKGISLFSYKNNRNFIQSNHHQCIYIPLVDRRPSRRVANRPKGTPGAVMRGPQVVGRTRGHNPLQIVYR